MVFDMTFKAAAAMATKYVAVYLSAADTVAVATSGTRQIGILQTTAAAAGEQVRVRLLGESYVKANGAFDLNDRLTGIATTGFVDTAVDGTDYPIAIALEAATAQNDEVKAFVCAAMAITKGLS